MRRGFTMIELIFIIVILGILATVAIPRLTIVRDDAEVAKAATNLSTLVADISSYYTSQGDFALSFKEMTNVHVNEDSDSGISDRSAGTLSNMTGSLKSAEKACIKISLSKAVANGKPATLLIEARNDSGDPLCAKILSMKTVKAFIEAKYKFTLEDGKPSGEQNGIAISGIGVKY